MTKQGFSRSSPVSTTSSPRIGSPRTTSTRKSTGSWSLSGSRAKKTPEPSRPLLHRPGEQPGDVVALQEQVDEDAGDDGDGDPGLEHAPIGAAPAGDAAGGGEGQREGQAGVPGQDD